MKQSHWFATAVRATAFPSAGKCFGVSGYWGARRHIWQDSAAILGAQRGLSVPRIAGNHAER